MKVYNVYVDEYDYDDYIDITVVAENENKAIGMIKTGYFGKCYFKERQGKIYVEEVDLTREHIVSTNFYGV